MILVTFRSFLDKNFNLFSVRTQLDAHEGSLAPKITSKWSTTKKLVQSSKSNAPALGLVSGVFPAA